MAAEARAEGPTFANAIIARATPARTHPTPNNPLTPLPTLDPIIATPPANATDAAGVALPPPPGLLPSWRAMIGLALTYVCVIAAFALIVILARLNPDVIGRAATGVVALVLLAIVPSLMLTALLVRRFSALTDLLQLALTTGWAVALIVPLLLVVQLVVALGTASGAFGRVHPWLGAFLSAYVQAGLLEEALKLNAVRAVLWKDVVADPRALLVYACGAANGFALVENLLYVLSSGLLTGILRAFLSVPAHTAWGMISGCLLAERKFLGKRHPWPLIVLRPAFLHGTYNFSLFAAELLPTGTPLWAYALLIAISPLVTIGSLAYVHVLAKRFEQVPLVEVRALQKAGLLPRVTLCSCAEDCAACLPCVSRSCEEKHLSRAGRNTQAASLQQLELQYRAQRSAREAAAAGGAPAGAQLPAAAEPAQPADGARYMLLTVPDGVGPGGVVEVVSPLSAQLRFAVRVPPHASAGWQMVVQHPPVDAALTA